MYYFKTPNAEANFNFSNATAFEAFADSTLSSTTSTTLQTKLSGTSTRDDTGSYILQWYCEVANSNNNATTDFRVQWKQTSSTTFITLTEFDTFIGRTDKFIPLTGFKIISNPTQSTIDFRIQFARGTGGTARIQNVNFYLFRILPT